MLVSVHLLSAMFLIEQVHYVVVFVVYFRVGALHLTHSSHNETLGWALLIFLVGRDVATMENTEGWKIMSFQESSWLLLSWY